MLVLRSTDRTDAVGFFSARVVNVTGASVVVQYNIDSGQQQVEKPQIMALEHCQSTDLLTFPSVPSDLVLTLSVSCEAILVLLEHCQDTVRALSVCC